MGTEYGFFRDQIEFCKKTWLTWIDKIDGCDIDWYWYSSNLEHEDEEVVLDENDEHHYIVRNINECATYERTYDIFRYLYKTRDYDYIIRVNTSTYVNLPLLCSILQRDFDKCKCFDKIYTAELISMPSLRTPFEFAPYCRGNLMVIPKDVLKKIVRYGELFNCCEYGHMGIVDDVVIGTIFNFENGDTFTDLVDNYCVLMFTFYKCCKEGINTNNSWSFRGENRYDFGNEISENMKIFYVSSVAIQIKNYEDRSVENDHYVELHNLMVENMDKIPLKDKLVFYDEQQNNKCSFVQGNVGYASCKTLSAMEKEGSLTTKYKKFLRRIFPVDHPSYKMMYDYIESHPSSEISKECGEWYHNTIHVYKQMFGDK